jgi:serine/threonine kinase 38
VSNFDKYDEEEPWISNDPPNKKYKKNRQQDLNFIGFTYKRDIENQRGGLVEALENLEKNYILDKFDGIQTDQ